MTAHYTQGSVTTIHDSGGVLGQPLGTFFWALTRLMYEVALRATSHMSQETQYSNYESPKESVQRPSNTPPKPHSVVMDPPVHCEVICDRALNQMQFQ